MITETDRLFARYRETGDPAILAQVFDATAHKLLLLAVHLTGDELGAEDLVQTAFLKVIEKAEQHDPTRPFLPWASAILANEARMAWRRSQQSTAGHRLTRPIAMGPHQAAAEAEMIGMLQDSIDSLDEKYQVVLRLKIVQGMKSVDIARTLDLPAETVRTRVSRGLSLLRKALPAGLSASAMILASGRGLAQARITILERAAQVSPHLRATTKPAIVRAAALRVLCGLVAAGIFIPIALWFSGAMNGRVDGMFSDGTIEGSTQSLASTQDKTDGGELTGRLTIRKPVSIGKQVAKAVGGAWKLTGTIRDTAGKPVTGASVRVSVLHGCDLVLLPGATTNDAGQYDLDVRGLCSLGDIGLLSASLQVEVEAEGYLPTAVFILDQMPDRVGGEHTFHCDRSLKRGAKLRAQIFSAGGLPVTSMISARLVEEGEDAGRTRTVRENDRSQIVLPVLAGVPVRLEVNCAEGIIRRPLGILSGEEDVDLGILRCEEYGLVQGRFVTADGSPVPYQNYRITWLNEGSWGESEPLRTEVVWREGAMMLRQICHGRADALGRFSCASLQSGRYRVELEFALPKPHLFVLESAAYRYEEPRVFVLETGAARADLTLQGQALEVQLRDATGRLVPGIPLAYETGAGLDRVQGILDVSDTGGVFHLLVPTNSAWSFHATPWRVVSETIQYQASGDAQPRVLVVPLSLAQATCKVDLSVVTATGRRISDYRVATTRPGDRDSPPALSPIELRDRQFPAGEYELILIAAPAAWGTADAFVTTVAEIELAEGGANRRAVVVTPGVCLEVSLRDMEFDLNKGSPFLEQRVESGWRWVSALSREIEGRRELGSAAEGRRPFRVNQVLPVGRLQLRVTIGDVHSQRMFLDARPGPVNLLRARVR